MMNSNKSLYEKSYVFKLQLLLLCMYGLLVQFGNLFRMSGTNDADAGLSTIVAILIIVFGGLRLINIIIMRPELYLVMLLALWTATVDYLSTYTEYHSLFSSLSIAIYAALTAAVVRVFSIPKTLPVLWIVVAFGVGLSGSISIIDYIGFYNFPYVNDVVIETDFDHERVTQASGFFPTRSAMAAIFSLSIGGLFVLALMSKGILLRTYFLLAGVSGFVCLMLTHNRSGILGVLIAVTFYLFFSRRMSLVRRVKVLTLAVMATVAFSFFMIEYFPSHVNVYYEKLIYMFDDSAKVDESDYGRLLIFKSVIASLLENPLGNGFTNIPVEGIGLINPHNVITSIIWSAGVVGILWLIVYGFVIYRLIKKVIVVSNANANRNYIDITILGLGAWMLGNMAHNSLSTGLAWIFLGVLISVSISGKNKRVRALHNHGEE